MKNDTRFRRPSQLEQLESRSVLAANPISVLSGDVVMKEGDHGVQFVEVAIQPSRVPSSKAEVQVKTTGTLVGNLGGGVASAGSDYQSLNRIVSWMPGDTSVQKVRIAVYGDTVYEGTESFFVLFSTNDSTTTVSKSALKITIKNDDVLPPPQPDASTLLSVGSVVIAESSQANRAVAQVQLKLKEAQAAPIRVFVQTFDGTANSGIDYIGGRFDVIFEAGETEKTIEITVLGDNIVEADENFIVRAASVGYRNSVDGTVVIKNDDVSSSNAKIAVFRNGTWLLDNGDGGVAERQVAFGLPGDIPLSGDYNGDGKLDLAVVRPNHVNGLLAWYLDYSADGTQDKFFQYGFNSDTPVAGDFDGNGKYDATVVRANRATGMLDWFVDTAGDGMYAEKVLNYGLIGDQVIAGDFDANGRSDATVIRKNGIYLDWYIDLAGNGGMAERVVTYGLAGDVPVVGDWDADNRSDFGVARSVPNSQAVDLLFDLDSRGGLQERAVRFGQRGDRFVSK